MKTLAYQLFFALALNSLAQENGVLTVLEKLEENQAVLLGKAGVEGDFNDTAREYHLDKTGPRGRDFSIKMVWAPDRRRALFCGANHNVPHRINDVWEFDLATLKWTLLYAPDLPRDYTGLGKDAGDVMMKDGVLVTKRGGPGVIGHSWWGLTYDSDLKEMLFLNTWVTDMKKAAALVGGDPEKLYAGPPLWAFSPDTGRWRPITPPAPHPRAIFGGMLEYVPDLKATLWHANNWQMQATWAYDAARNGWKNLEANGNDDKDFAAQAAQPEQVGYYDPARKMIIAHRHWATSHYDVRANTWKKVIDEPAESTAVPHGHDAFAPMYHDPRSGHGLLVEFKNNRLWAYDPDATKWKSLEPAGDPMPTGNKRLAYHDPERNVFVIIENTTVWVYRYRR